MTRRIPISTPIRAILLGLSVLSGTTSFWIVGATRAFEGMLLFSPLAYGIEDLGYNTHFFDHSHFYLLQEERVKQTKALQPWRFILANRKSEEGVRINPKKGLRYTMHDALRPKLMSLLINGNPAIMIGICFMPTLLTVKGIRFFFYSSEKNEPPHIHFEKGKAIEKAWMDPIKIVYGPILKLLKKE